MENSKIFRSWLDNVSPDSPLWMAGPCSAESEEQVLQLAHQLKNTPVKIFRAGIWKPRTRPGSFEGVGEIGLKWLQKAKEETGLLTAVEVANANHVALAIAHDVDVLWIGARTAVNPFTIQELADALQNTDKIVLLKNPINPDLSLWIGGLERLYNAGITNLGVIHRGFSSYEKNKYRNTPHWQIPIELQNRFPDLPIICDPSHISGNRELLQEVAQTALDLNYDGFMMEVHPNPDKAWSDAAQQITPERFVALLESLHVRKPSDDADEYQKKLQQLRTQIDELDDQLLQILGNRMHIAETIGNLKKEKNVAILQNKRWHDILLRMVENGHKIGLSEDFVLQLFKAIHQESILHQEKVMNTGDTHNS